MLKKKNLLTLRLCAATGKIKSSVPKSGVLWSWVDGWWKMDYIPWRTPMFKGTSSRLLVLIFTNFSHFVGGKERCRMFIQREKIGFFAIVWASFHKLLTRWGLWNAFKKGILSLPSEYFDLIYFKQCSQLFTLQLSLKKKTINI